ncbi:hypothetical protein HaLaN_28589, partial [Haematococcus lacustris]
MYLCCRGDVRVPPW